MEIDRGLCVAIVVGGGGGGNGNGDYCAPKKNAKCYTLSATNEIENNSSNKHMTGE